MTSVELPPVDPDRMSQADLIAVGGMLDEFLEAHTDAELEQVRYVWSFWRRPNQMLPPGRWGIWFVRAGRGYGKTRTGAESVRELVTERQTHGRVGIVAPTAGDARDVMIEGESGLLAVHPPDTRPRYEPSKRRLTWPNGAVGSVFSAEEPGRLRGPQYDLVWGDEPASRNWLKEDGGAKAIDNIRFGLRLGSDPRLILTGTPKPVPWIKAIQQEPTTVTTTGSTYENLRNLAAPFISMILGRYEGTRLGRQELHAEMLDDVEGALWTQLVIEDGRIAAADWDVADPWRSLNGWLVARGDPMVLGKRRPWRTIVAVDPPGSTAECGIVVAAGPTRGAAGRDHAVVVGDYSLAGPPERWASEVVRAYRLHGCQAAFVEDNQGGDMTRAVIHAVDPTVPIRKVHASDSKKARAEPVSALYEAGFVHHVGFWTLLEDQMTTWVPTETPKSPDRLDALVHAIRELLPPRDVRAGRVAYNPADDSI